METGFCGNTTLEPLLMSLCPIVPCTGLAKHKIIWTEELAKRSSTHRIHGTWFEIHQDCTWHIATTSCFLSVCQKWFYLFISVFFQDPDFEKKRFCFFNIFYEETIGTTFFQLKPFLITAGPG